ncbi:hypothetical protein HIM_03881 [Hirsutella minnesotensis 3608]|uniref:HTH CENPB-type domain-containing protein n=1 Tax=Hirsutella minnesotensis 3608 TaxID=1043627 RepID=A0A0F7ZQ32_9HYPO|nr:hypothetical protein HIM_03881 [Hirsutella minnesotensis 3608]
MAKSRDSTVELRVEEALGYLDAHPGAKPTTVARQFAVPRARLLRRIDGIFPRAGNPATNTKLSKPEETALCRYIDRLDRINLPTRKAFIRDTANYILRARASRAEQADPPTVGKKWVDRFIKRHKYDIVPSHVLDANRQASEDPEAINAWFLKYKAVVAEHGIVADDIWNMDETGFQIGVGKDQMVVTKRRRAHYFSLPTNRESATAVEAISATGRVIPVFLILSGTMHMANWYRLEELDKDTVIGTSPTGYSNDELSMAWIQHFEAYTKKGAVGSKRLLLMDGYGSHCTREFIQYCDDSSIVPFGFPPHSTHLLQPLDVVMFQPLKHYHAEALDLIVRDGCANITKIEFLSVIQEVRRKAFREDSILSAFKKSGLVPYDPLVVMRRIQERQERALTPPPPPAPELQSSPFNTPVTLRQLKKIAYDLQTQAKEEDFNPALKRTLDQFVRGALTQGTELLYTMRDLKRTKMAEEVTRRRRSQKNQQLKAGGVLTVDHARKIVVRALVAFGARRLVQALNLSQVAGTIMHVRAAHHPRHRIYLARLRQAKLPVQAKYILSLPSLQRLTRTQATLSASGRLGVATVDRVPELACAGFWASACETASIEVQEPDAS